ncbi:MAG: hypothetical protein J6Y11_01400 [Paludibacteraceae bacterium]|nr:hypothetical protein [Paludibacteraceae bacterium]
MKHSLLKIFPIVLFLLSSVSCVSASHDHNISFYHWKSNYQMDNDVRKYMRGLNCQKIYLHLFDVVKEGEISRPINIFQVTDSLKNDSSIHFVPVIFITNEVFSNTDTAKINGLTHRLKYFTDNMIRHSNINKNTIDEIQFDCDWTPSTKENYFTFLKYVKNLYPDVKISSTIRLHQIKDMKETGIPPVDKGYLMCYATSNANDGLDSNSILNIDLLKNYTENLNDYPIDLDYALPLFSWGIVSNKKSQIKLINGLTHNDLDSVRFKRISENRYKVCEDCFINGLYINKGYTIEIEQITPTLLRNAIEYLDNKIQKDYNIVYYHLSKGFLNRYTIDELK